MSKTMKRVSALLLAILMILAYMPMMQDTAYAAKKAKKPAKVKGLKATVKKGSKKISLSWKKAKNAKKYEVTIKDMSTKLTAKKTTKKKKLTVTGQWSTKYQIKVRGINGKKKGGVAKKTVKIGANPKAASAADVNKAKADAAKAQAEAENLKKDLEDALAKAAENEAAAQKLEKQLADAQKAVETLQTIAASNQNAVAASEEAIAAAEEALAELKAAKEAWDALDETEEGRALKEQIRTDNEDLYNAMEAIDDDVIADAEKAIEDAKDAIDLAVRDQLELDSWNPEVKNAINDMIVANKGDGKKYVVFDFDNTCSIFDVEEQLAVYQLQTMAFAETVTPTKLAEILATGLDKDYFPGEDGKPKKDEDGKDIVVDNDGLATTANTYQDWIDDIVAAFTKLDAEYNFTPAGLTEAQQAEIQATDDWKEFATKMRAMYDVVFATESADVAYPWVLYWFTGMTEEQVYELAKKSHTYYKSVETSEVPWEAPKVEGAKVEGAHYTWTSGTQVSENIRELWKALDANGIDVWVCSASATDPIRAAIDVWGGHDYITGMMAMTNKLDADGKYINEYDWDSGYAWIPNDSNENHGWTKDDVKQKAQTQGKGKVLAIQNILYPKYGVGPIAGFMDSTGDYNFCTEFETLQVVVDFNRASRKVTDGGGVIAEVAVYQADTLGYDYAKAQEAGDTLYVLQGREEYGLRGFRPERETMRYGKTSTLLFREQKNYDQLQHMIDNKMTTEDVVNQFAIKKAGGATGNPFNFDIGFVKGDEWNSHYPGVADFAGYHTQN